MEIRPLSKTDDRYAVSRVYEESWKKAYKDIMPQSYLDGIPPGKWVEALDNPEWHSLIMLDGGQIIGTAAYCASRFSALRG
ncbi:MAG: GNAT family N-acetyltransferase, partial [Oscillospiraceae bacterium]|nr:GNAT family N-acetyltransferase [Oscillospiraceae bacterium]